MKRPVIIVALLLTAASAYAFDPVRKELRIAIVTSPVSLESGAPLLARMLREELRAAGTDAFTIEASRDELLGENPREEADLVVELASLGTRADQYGGVNIGAEHVDLGLGIVGSTVATELRVYQVPGGELLFSQDLVRRRSALMPTGIGLGGRHFFGWIGFPIGEVTQQRRAARAVAKDAAAIVLDAVRPE